MTEIPNYTPHGLVSCCCTNVPSVTPQPAHRRLKKETPTKASDTTNHNRCEMLVLPHVTAFATEKKKDRMFLIFQSTPENKIPGVTAVTLHFCCVRFDDTSLCMFMHRCR